ncbi:carboxylesterase 1-like [Ipomoea triloba]|uniref:carboxylesterase 1-like n=1 Tax=Ipomoea triloba TaxID=35885 RepID=UPI00125D7681|nr:carboxylesterase 1-like [Ipomoea triloba]
MDPKDVEIYDMLGFECNPDGSVTRQRELHSTFELTPAVDPSLVLAKDISINQSKTTWARIMLPRKAVDSQPLSKLPLIVYFHGGGFIVSKVDTPYFQDFYRHIATEVSAVVVSVEYRRAPEHRLPAAYDDCMEALYWIKNSDDEWLTKYADFSRCFLMGTSAGGNIAYRVGLSASSISTELKPLEIRGLILHHPYFGGKERTGSELRSVDDKLFSLRQIDLMWETALPAGADRDHVYCNAMVEIRSNPGMFDQVKALGLKILVWGCGGDPLVDRQVEVLNALRDAGVEVVGRIIEGGYHGLEIADPLKAKDLCIAIKEFVAS